MPKRRVILYTSSEGEEEEKQAGLKIRPKRDLKISKKLPKKKIVAEKLVTPMKPTQNDDEFSETDSGSESDLSFVVSDSESEAELMPPKKILAIQKTSKFATKSSKLSSIIGKKRDPITMHKFQTTLTKSLFQFYNIDVFKSKLPSNLKITWNERLISAAGRCMYEPKLSIELSPKIIKTDRFKLRDILLHEMVHAVAFTTKKEYGHGKTFYEISNEVERILPKIPRVERCHNFKIEYKYTYRCVDCGMKYNRQKRTINVSLDTCGECRGKLKMKTN